jgi:hypothetical protein
MIVNSFCFMIPETRTFIPCGGMLCDSWNWTHIFFPSSYSLNMLNDEWEVLVSAMPTTTTLWPSFSCVLSRMSPIEMVPGGVEEHPSEIRSQKPIKTVIQSFFITEPPSTSPCFVPAPAVSPAAAYSCPPAPHSRRRGEKCGLDPSHE